MKMTQAKNKTSMRIRIISVVALLAVLIALSVILSFAWFQNNIDVEGTGVTTGKMLYEFKGYHYNAQGDLINDFDYSTADGEKGSAENDRVVVDSITPTSKISHFAPVGRNQVGQMFFSVSQLADSIDFRVMLSFDLEGLAVTDSDGNVLLGSAGNALEYLNSMWFKFYDESGALIAYMNTAGNTVDGYITSTNSTSETAAKLLKTEDCRNLSEILGARVSNDLKDGNNQFFVRMVYGWNADVLATQHTDVNIPLLVKISVAQIGVEEAETTGVIPVYTTEDLRAALDNYLPGQTLQVMSNITYVGDITLTRPVTISMLGSTLTVQGNLSYVNADVRTFKINTEGGGRLIIKKNTNGIGGNLIADLPDSSLEFYGTNSAEAGMADVYIEGDFRVYTSVNTGLKLNAVRICHLEPSQDPAESTELQDITVTGGSRIQVAARTYAGKIVASGDCGRIVIVNSGFIAQLNLQAMWRDTALTEIPVIDVDSYGFWTDPMILLPQWSVKFRTPEQQEEGTPRVYTGNTRIMSNMGSGIMKAYSSGHENFINGQPDAAFFSNKELVGIRDDIEYEFRDFFVELLNAPSKTEILVHYELPAAERLEQYIQNYPDFGRSLRHTVGYYIGKGDVAPVAELTRVTVICYGENELTADDYAFLREMRALVELDISECVSTNNVLPDGALKDLTNLTTVKLPNYDTEWEPQILLNTAVQELWLPANLQKLANSTTYDASSKKYVENYDVINNIRVIHTSHTIPAGSLNTYGLHNRVNGMLYNTTPQKAVKQYFFVPDAATLATYRALFDGETGNRMVWKRTVFLEAQRYGDYFLRLNDSNMTCEFVTNVKNAVFDPVAENFNFETITVNNKVYTITSYDDYAFCYRFPDTNFALTLPTTVNYVGAYAFAGAANPSNAILGGSLSSVTLLGNAKLGDYAFAYNRNMTEFTGTQVTSMGGYVFYYCDKMQRARLNSLSEITGSGAFSNCSALTRLDIGLIEETTTNASNFTQSVNSMLLVEIHTAGEALPAYTQALTASIGRTFVQDFYANLYTKYFGHLAELGTHTMDTILRADANGNVLPQNTPQDQVAYYFFPVLDENGQETEKTVLSACMLGTINGGGRNLTTMGTFVDTANNKTYTVTRIGRAAYRTTVMGNINTLMVSNDVTEIGHGAFAGDTVKKYCVTLDLNNTTIAEADAFYGVEAIRLYGNNLVETGLRSIANMPSLVVACLPKLDRLTGAITTTNVAPADSVFSTCKSLRVAYVGPSSNVRYMKYDGGTTSHGNTIPTSANHTVMFFIDGKNISTTTAATNFNLQRIFIGNAETSMYTGAYKVAAGDNFSNLVLSDWYTVSGNSGTEALGMVPYSFVIPGYVYTKGAEENILTLQMATTDLSSLPGVDNYADLYLSPEVLYQEGTITLYDTDHTDGVPAATMPRYTAREDKGGEYAYKVTKIEARSYNYVVVNSTVLKIGKYTTYIGTNTFGYHSGITSSEIDLSNVAELGESVFQCNNGTAPTSVTKLTANHLRTIAYMGLGYLYGLEYVYLPAVETMGGYAFFHCEALIEAVIGENFVQSDNTAGQDLFGFCKSLKRIVLLSRTSALVTPKYYSNGNSYFGGNGDVANLSIVVSANLLKDTDGDGKYDTYTDGKRTHTGNVFGNVPFENITIFEGFYSENQLTYFWQKVGDGMAAITSMVGGVGATLTLPSTVLDEEGNPLTVVSVSDSVFTSLPAEVKTVVLPSGMEYLTFLPSSLPSSLTGLVIADENAKFKTEGGVLYSKDMTTIYVFPRGLRTKDLSFTLPDTLQTIEYEAFYGVEYLTTLVIEGVVVIRDRAFANALNLEMIIFSSSTPSVFAGRDSFLNRNSKLALWVPEGFVGTTSQTILDAYRANVWHDFDILGLFNSHKHVLGEFGYCTAPGCKDPDANIEDYTVGTQISVAQDGEEKYYKVTLEAGKSYKLTTKWNALFGSFAYDGPVWLSVDPAASNPRIEGEGTYAGITMALSGRELSLTVEKDTTLYLRLTPDAAGNYTFAIN